MVRGTHRVPCSSKGASRLLSSRNGEAVSNDYPRLAVLLAPFARGSRELRSLVICSRAGGPFAGSWDLWSHAHCGTFGPACSKNAPRFCHITKGAKRLSNDGARSLAYGAYFARARRARGRRSRPRNPWSFERAKISRDAVRTRSVLTASGIGGPALTERRRRRLSNHGEAATRPAPSSPTRTGFRRSSSRNWTPPQNL